MRILLIDDNLDVLRALGRLLGMCGYDVQTAATYGDALRVAGADAGGPIELLITDLHLPDGDGLTLLAELRRRCGAPRLPGIALTGDVGRETTRACMAAGFALHLKKPVDFDGLLAAIVAVAGGGAGGVPAGATYLPAGAGESPVSGVAGGSGKS